MRIKLLFIAVISCNSFAWEMGPTGGLGGSEFRDPESRIDSIKLCGATKVDSITTTYSGGQTIKHGGNGGTCSTIDFPNTNPSIPNSPNLRLVKVNGCFNGSTISSMTLTRADGYSITKGECSGSPFSYGSDPHSWQGEIAGFFGRSGSLIDSIGVYTRGVPFYSYGPSGGKGGTPFEVSAERVSSITVCWGSKIDSITLNYAGPMLTPPTKIGGNGGDICTTQNLFGAQIYSISGFYTSTAVIHFTLSTGYGGMTFGNTDGRVNFKYDGGVIRKFVGRSGSLIDAIGAAY